MASGPLWVHSFAEADCRASAAETHAVPLASEHHSLVLADAAVQDVRLSAWVLLYALHAAVDRFAVRLVLA